MSATAAFGEQLDALGVWWPRGDGDAVRDLSTGWTQLADLVEDIAAVLDSVTRSVTENYRGDAADRFAELWLHWTGERGYLATTVADCRRVAAAAADFSGDIDLADRTLLRLVEEALAGLTQLTPERLRWLQECSATVAGDLSARVDVRCHGLHQVRPIDDIRTPADIDRAAIDPAAISWPDMGKPLDLAHLATTTVDFGAGQGVLPSSLVPSVPPSTPPSNASPTDPFGALGLLPNGAGITINAPGATINIGVPAAASSELPADPLLEPPAETSEELLPDPLAGIGGGGGGGGGFGGGGFGGGSGISFDPPVVPDFAADVPALTLPEVTPPLTPLTPISVDPPTADLLSPGTLGLGAAGAAAALAATTGGGGGGGKAPFFPFMPMAGGGASGDDSPEPKRRSNRK